MGEQTPAEKEVDWKAIGFMLKMGMLDAALNSSAIKPAVSMELQAEGGKQALAWKLLQETALLAGKGLHAVEEPFLPIIAAFVAPILGGLFGAEIDEAALRNRLRAGEGTAGAQAIMDGFIKAIVGNTPAEIEPSDEGSRRIAAAAVQASLESTFNAYVPEILSHLLPFDVGHFEHLAELPENIIRSLGVGRLVRRALGPIVNTCCTTPATWHMNKLHRPTLLGAGTLAKQIARNPDKREMWLEDLRREGYSEARIEALLNEQAKFHSVSDVFRLQRADVWTESDAVKHLADQGYAADVAATELQLEKLKAIESFDRSMASTALDAFAGGRIDEAELAGFCSGVTISAQEKAQLIELAHTRRICGRRGLTPGEAAGAVRAGVLSFVDYRRALERDGRDDEAITVLELMLRAELDAKKDVEQHRAELEAQRAAEKLARDRAALERKAAADAKLALDRRGRVSDLEVAYVRGLIPLDRVREVYGATYDPDTAGVLDELLQSRRVEYVARQEAAEKAKTRATARGVNVGELETAVLAGVLTLDQFGQRLHDLDFAGDDADLLTATLRAKIAARDEAERKRDAAAAAAKVRHVDLAAFELLVRRGHRTVPQYAALLQSLNFDEGAVAALVERLQILIDDDAATVAKRQAAEAKLQSRGLSLEQFRRAVLLGVKTVNDYATFLLDQKFAADAIAVLVAEVETDLDEAEAARRRRQEAERRSQAGSAPISSVRRAARLGLIPVSVYETRLRAAGYSDDDIALESDLLATERADDAARAAAADAADAASADRGLTLGQLAAAVKAGTATIDQYTARALAIGLSAADAEILTRTLQDTIDTLAAAADRQRTLAGDAAPRELARADLEKAVRKGVITIDDYAARLPGLGYSDDDAALLVAVLEATLDASGGA
jgi:hypothetical protein